MCGCWIVWRWWRVYSSSRSSEGLAVVRLERVERRFGASWTTSGKAMELLRGSRLMGDEARLVGDDARLMGDDVRLK